MRPSGTTNRYAASDAAGFVIVMSHSPAEMAPEDAAGQVG